MSSSVSHAIVVVLTASLCLVAATILVRADGLGLNKNEPAATTDSTVAAPFVPYGRDTIWTGIVSHEPALSMPAADAASAAKESAR